MSGGYITVSSSVFAVGTLILAIGTLILEMVVEVLTRDPHNLSIVQALVSAAKKGVPTCCEMVIQGPQLRCPVASIFTVVAFDFK